MLLWGCQPDDALGFEEYLAAQNIPVIRVPWIADQPAILLPNATTMGTSYRDERVPEPEPITGAIYPCGEAWAEDPADRLARMLQREEMANNMLWGDLERVKADRDRWRRSCGVACGVALAALMALAAVWR